MPQQTFKNQLLATKLVPMAQRQKNAIEWYKQSISKLTGTSGRPTKTQMIIQTMVNAPDTAASVGRMFLYYYDPKTKEQMKYYDRFPLVMPIEMYKDGFLGINFHYLPPDYRLALLERLYDFTTTDKINARSRLQLSYKLLATVSKYKAFRPCLKRYLYSHIGSNIKPITPEDWTTAIYLPVDKFEKKSNTEVWKDSMKQADNLVKEAFIKPTINASVEEV